jgi:hypothetical protein
MKAGFKNFWLVATAAALAASACGGDDGDDPAPVDASFVLTTTLVSDDDATSYLVFLESLEAGSVSLASAREYSGFVTTFVRDGRIFIAEEQAPTVVRYDLGPGGEMTNEVRLSFASYGLASVGYGISFLASSTRAYVSLDASQRLVWDPGAMEILSELELDLPAVTEGFEANASYDRGLRVRGTQVFQSIYEANWTSFRFAPASHVAIWDVSTDAPVAVPSAPCPMLDAATMDDDGNLYYSNWVHAVAAAYQAPAEAPPPCAVRIAAGATAIDESWTRDLTALTGGRPVMNLQYAGDGTFVAAVFDESRAELPVDDDDVYGANWEVRRFDLAAGTSTPVTGIEWNDGGYTVYRFDGTTYILVTIADGGETLGYRLDGTTATEVFRVPGAGYQISPL